MLHQARLRRGRVGRPEFLEQAAEEVLKEEWARRSWSKLPQGGGIDVEGVRLE